MSERARFREWGKGGIRFFKVLRLYFFKAEGRFFRTFRPIRSSVCGIWKSDWVFCPILLYRNVFNIYNTLFFLNVSLQFGLGALLFGEDRGILRQVCRGFGELLCWTTIIRR